MLSPIVSTCHSSTYHSSQCTHVSAYLYMRASLALSLVHQRLIHNCRAKEHGCIIVWCARQCTVYIVCNHFSFISDAYTRLIKQQVIQKLLLVIIIREEAH